MKTLHARAKRQAHNLVALLFDELPEGWTDDIEINQFDLELWLATFDVKAGEQNLTGLALQKAVRQRAETYYVREWKQPHHTLVEWAFFRFRLEMALLQTIGDNKTDTLTCYAYHNVLSGIAYRETCLQERLDWPPPADPSANTPF